MLVCLIVHVFYRLQGPSNTSRDENSGRNIRVTGAKGQRNLSVCVSDFIHHMGLQDAVVDQRQQLYLHKVSTSLYVHHLVT